MDRQFNLGIIGMGMVAETHIEAFRKVPDVSISWICSVEEEKLKKQREEYQVKNATMDYRQILADPAVDAVVICTPPNLHMKMSVEALAAGKHVLLEKPMCLSMEEAGRIVAESEKHPELVLLDCSCRYSRLQPKFEFVREFIKSGRLGDVYYIHHNFVRRQTRSGIEHNPEAKWFLDKKLAGGGPMFNWGVYDISFHMGILDDEPALRHVEAMTKNGLDRVAHGAPVFDIEEHGAAFMEFDTGLRYYFERSTNAHNSTGNETRIYGTKGGLKFSYLTWDSNEIEYFYTDDDGRGKARSEKIPVNMGGHPEEDTLALDRHFIDCIRGNAVPAMPAKTAARNLDIIFQILNAAETTRD